MRIDQLTVQNFRCFEELAMDFHPEFNVLVGENGTGKTTLLQALAVAAGCWFVRLTPLNPPRIDVQDVRRTIASLGEEYQSQNHYPVLVQATGSVLSRELSWSRERSGPKAAVRKSFRLDRLASETAAAINESPQTSGKIILPVVVFYRASRLWQTAEPDTDLRRPMKQTDLSRLEGYRGALLKSAEPNSLVRWLERQDRITYQEGREPSLYRVVLDAMQVMIENAAEVRFDNRTLEIIVRFDSGDTQPYSQLSDGQRNMLALAGDLAMRMARLNPHLGKKAATDTHGIVLIDELDLHLHPRWQRHVVADLRRAFPKVQFITTTHSPQIIGEVEPECVFSLANNGTVMSPAQTEGMDTDFILRNVMHASERQRGTTVELKAIEGLIREEQYESAQESIDALRTSLGPFPELTSLQTRIDRIRLLGDKR